MSGVYWEMARTLGTQGQKGYKDIRGHGAPMRYRGHLGVSGVSEGVGVSGCIGASKHSRYSGAKRGIGTSGGIRGTPRGM